MKRLSCLIVLLATATLCWSADPAQRPLKIGSKRFTESYILAHLMAQTVTRATGTAPEVRQGLGNTAIVYEALRSGSIDLYPEYAGTIALEILKNPEPMSLAAMNQALAPLGFGAAIALGFNDGYALAMRAADAQRLGMSTLSDLAGHRELKLGLFDSHSERSSFDRELFYQGGGALCVAGGQRLQLFRRRRPKPIDLHDEHRPRMQLRHRVEADRRRFPK